MYELIYIKIIPNLSHNTSDLLYNTPNLSHNMPDLLYNISDFYTNQLLYFTFQNLHKESFETD